MPPCWSLLNKIKPFRISLLWFIGNQTRFVVVEQKQQKQKKLHIPEPPNHSSRQSCTSVLIGDDLCQGATETWMRSDRPLHTTREARYRTLQHQSPSQHNRARSRGKACEGEAWGHLWLEVAALQLIWLGWGHQGFLRWMKPVFKSKQQRTCELTVQHGGRVTASAEYSISGLAEP